MKEKVELIIKKFDYIGKTFNFRYKSYENYRSLTGGILFIFFLILTLIFSIINLNYLFHRQNKSINNFNTIISPTDTLNFLNHSFSLGFQCLVINMMNQKILLCQNYLDLILYMLQD